MRAAMLRGMPIKGCCNSHERRLQCNLIPDAAHHPLAMLTKIWGAKRGANVG